MAETNGYQGNIFDIKRFAVHDGPGIRTTVFLKGCSLRCAWCHNPEAIKPQPEVAFYAGRCIDCRACLAACPYGAHEITAAGERFYHRDRCRLCGQCVETCYAEALVMHGRRVTVEEVMAEVRQDASFYQNSGGGVTLSGGEPLLQGRFATALLQQCQAEGFHTAVDTCGQVGWKALERALPYLDLVLYDLKHIDPQWHRQYTGASNQRILENLRRLSRCGLPIEIRMPIIPTINDAQAFVEGAAAFLASLANISAVRLLAYHRLAGAKYRSLGQENTMPDVDPPTPDHMLQIAAWIARYGLEVIVPEAG